MDCVSGSAKRLGREAEIIGLIFGKVQYAGGRVERTCAAGQRLLPGMRCIWLEVRCTWPVMRCI